MRKEGKHIGQLFKETLEGYEVAYTPLELKKIKKRLFWLRFYRFSYRHFNVYYCALFLLAILFLTYPLINHSPTQDPVTDGNTNSISDSILQPSDNVNSEKVGAAPAHPDGSDKNDSSNHKSNGIVKSKPADTFFQTGDGGKKDNTIRQDCTAINTTMESIDNRKINTNLITDSANTQVIKSPVIIKKRDTLVVIDTVKVAKKDRKKTK